MSCRVLFIRCVSNKLLSSLFFFLMCSFRSILSLMCCSGVFVEIAILVFLDGLPLMCCELVFGLFADVLDLLCCCLHCRFARSDRDSCVQEWWKRIFLLPGYLIPGGSHECLLLSGLKMCSCFCLWHSFFFFLRGPVRVSCIRVEYVFST